MLILGIETSCDETAVAVVRDGRRVLSSVVASQIDQHRPFGGVVPELASREHLRAILPLLDGALQEAGVSGRDLDGIAVTYRPGLIGALLVGVSAAKALALLWDCPLVAVDHIQAHVWAAGLEPLPRLHFPLTALVVSGGHTSLYRFTSPLRGRRIASTRDDAAGEAFDKTAAILGLGYPGGPEIDRVAREGRAGAVRFPRGKVKGAPLDFTFSGLKTAVLYHTRGYRGRRGDPIREGISIPDTAASFQEAVVDVLVARTLEAARASRTRQVVVAGGVACNGRLRARMAEAFEGTGIDLAVPAPGNCTDNAAMVAGLGHERLAAGRTADLTLDATPTGWETAG